MPTGHTGTPRRPRRGSNTRRCGTTSARSRQCRAMPDAKPPPHRRETATAPGRESRPSGLQPRARHAPHASHKSGQSARSAHNPVDNPRGFGQEPTSAWGCSSVGRALEWHSRGQEFNSPQLHQNFAGVIRKGNPCAFLRPAIQRTGAPQALSAANPPETAPGPRPLHPQAPRPSRPGVLPQRSWPSHSRPRHVAGRFQAHVKMLPPGHGGEIAFTFRCFRDKA